MTARKRSRSEPAARSRRAVGGSRRILHLDAFSGIAGNMFLGALLDAGLSRRELSDGLAGLGVAHTLRVRRVQRGPLAARYVSVGVPKAARKILDIGRKSRFTVAVTPLKIHD